MTNKKLQSQMNCSLMMSHRVVDEQRNKLSNYGNFSGAFTKTDKSTAAKTNVKHRIFTGDHAPINQRPTESRRLKDASFMKEVQKIAMKEAGLKLNSKCLFAAQEVKILGHLVSSNGVRPDPDKIKASLLKSGVEFHWGPEEVEAFNSLKESTSDPVLGMYDERASTEIHTDASGYSIGAVLVQIQNNVEKSYSIRFWEL
ncbi:transposon Ty3-I Gag-Pol polyprotein [Trichonephila clavipes]|nr:transposon Ty3-I Gag-Pol polyprotein [Trichonephila clavipes]